MPTWNKQLLPLLNQFWIDKICSSFKEFQFLAPKKQVVRTFCKSIYPTINTPMQLLIFPNPISTWYPTILPSVCQKRCHIFASPFFHLLRFTFRNRVNRTSLLNHGCLARNRSFNSAFKRSGRTNGTTEHVRPERAEQRACQRGKWFTWQLHYRSMRASWQSRIIQIADKELSPDFWFFWSGFTLHRIWLEWPIDLRRRWSTLVVAHVRAVHRSTRETEIRQTNVRSANA